MKTKTINEFIRDLYKTNEFIPLHAPTFDSTEKAFLLDTIDSTFVSSVGKYVDEFEQRVANYTGATRAVATTNGTAALHTSLHLADIKAGDLVITQALTFVATCNALFHLGAEPVFVDVSANTLGLCPNAVDDFLEQHAVLSEQGCIHQKSGRRIKAALPVHTFGHPVELDALISVCEKWGITLIEDAAESLGSFYKGQHTGTFGLFGAISFNGNKIITTGGGGMVLCNDAALGDRIKHITTTAKVPHPYEFYHDEAGFNYRMPNLNAALGCAQIEKLDTFIKSKRELAANYKAFFDNSIFRFVDEPAHAKSNFWLNAVLCPDQETRDKVLAETNGDGVMTRPVWRLMHRLPMYKNALRGSLPNAEYFEAHLINLPSSPVSV